MFEIDQWDPETKTIGWTKGGFQGARGDNQGGEWYALLLAPCSLLCASAFQYAAVLLAPCSLLLSSSQVDLKPCYLLLTIRRYVENIFEELDNPNEYFFNEDTKQLFYAPNSTDGKAGPPVGKFEAVINQTIVKLM